MKVPPPPLKFPRLNTGHSDSVPEIFFLKKLILKLSADDNKSMQNYPACKEVKAVQAAAKKMGLVM